MSEQHGDHTLVNLWRAGDQKAADAIFHRYVEKLVGLARRRISERLASRVDPEDVVQSVFRTFFARAKEGQFTVEDPDDLCKLLVKITVNKTLRQVDYHKAAKRDPNQERGQSAASQEQMMELLDREPTPSDANAFIDQLEHFLARFKPADREIIELRMQGYSNEEIAAKLGTYDRKIRRVMEHVKGIAEEEWSGLGGRGEDA